MMDSQDTVACVLKLAKRLSVTSQIWFPLVLTDCGRYNFSEAVSSQINVIFGTYNKLCQAAAAPVVNLCIVWIIREEVVVVQEH